MSALWEGIEGCTGTFFPFYQQERSRITVCNTGQMLLPAWSAGKVGSGIHRDAENVTDLFAVSAAVDENSPWGILPAAIAPGETGELILAGSVPAWITGNNAGTRVCATAAGLRYSTHGRGEVLFRSGWETIPSMILLGTLCGTEYNGYFKVIPTGTGCRIVNGRAPESSICGYTDLPGCTQVAATELENFSGTLYLHALHDSDGYHTLFGGYDSSHLMQLPIAYVNAFSAEQYLQDETARFGREFFL